MNASSWRKAADLIAQGTQANQQIQAAATADSSQLESFSLSSLAADDSGPPQVNYGTEQPLTVSTPKDGMMGDTCLLIHQTLNKKPTS